MQILVQVVRWDTKGKINGTPLAMKLLEKRLSVDIAETEEVVNRLVWAEHLMPPAS
jgi:hypothetical protein